MFPVDQAGNQMGEDPGVERGAAVSREKLTAEVIAEAVRLVKTGLSDADVSAVIGVRPDTFSKWKNHPKNELQIRLGQELKKAESERKGALLARILKASEGNWQAAAWLLERKYPAEFAKPDRYREDGVSDAIQAVKELTATIKARCDGTDSEAE